MAFISQNHIILLRELISSSLNTQVPTKEQVDALSAELRSRAAVPGSFTNVINMKSIHYIRANVS